MNDAGFTLNDAAVTARNAQYPGTPFTDPTGAGTYADPYLGCNRAGSNAPGIGIATFNGQCKADDWTVVDQNGLARDPQQSQHLGGNPLGEGSEGLNTVTDINVLDGTDINDTFSLLVETNGWIRNINA